MIFDAGKHIKKWNIEI